MLKINLLFKKFTNFTAKHLENKECGIFRLLLLYEHKHIGRFPSLHEFTFNDKNLFYQRFVENKERFRSKTI